MDSLIDIFKGWFCEKIAERREVDFELTNDREVIVALGLETPLCELAEH